MNALIPIQSQAGIQTVNARELHQFLEVGKDFSNWIKDRIEKYGFSEGTDFTPELAKSSGGRPSLEYHVTLAMAKELSMVERNEKGKQARQYFIECERRAMQPFAIPQTLPEALRLAADLQEKVNEQDGKLEEAAPKIEFHDRVTASNDVLDMAAAVRLAKLPFGRNTLLNKLREAGVLMTGGRRHNLPLKRFISQGLFTVNESAYEDSKGEKHVTLTTYVTQKGVAWLVRKFGRSAEMIS
ncbi:antA/AntB antirepressor family protein [Luteolibacter pohnpeiensis]|uniref:AntA/AntB antirepressor family protein n=1 Tax=Luteolibacter pohnpeiensis TaxID=454153 RepID=A0A934VY05_9BACT|nr:antA/AntB antirepressor family protein [Luteolibacter pohnpeiensis]MBK1884393.1 antA/AntB antirepressor family protein [Luteolibacter pohnpeiensis]